MSAAVRPLPVIDVDSHWTEPPDLWTSRAPASLKDRALRVQRNDQGVEQWREVFAHQPPEGGWNNTLVLTPDNMLLVAGSAPGCGRSRSAWPRSSRALPTSFTRPANSR